MPAASAELDEEVRSEAFRVVSKSVRESSATVERRRGVVILGAVHEARSAELLLEVLRHDSDARVRSAAAYTLSNLPAELLAPLRDELDLLSDDAESVRKALEQLRRRARPKE